MSEPPQTDEAQSEPLDLELCLESRLDCQYAFYARLRVPGQPADERLLDPPANVHIDLESLLATAHSPERYGRALTAMLCSDQRAPIVFLRALERARGAGRALRMRLVLPSRDELLHQLRWETLQSPLDGSFLTPRADLLFVRSIESDDQTPIATPSLTALPTLVAVAAPEDLGSYGLAPIDRQHEQRLAAESLAGQPLVTLGKVTLERLAEALRAGPAVLYLVCHGRVVGDSPVFYLDDERGGTHAVLGAQLVALLRGLPRRPALVVLASCHSAGQSHARDAQVAVAPQLARAGVAAVVALLDAVSQAAARAALVTCFEELSRHGRVDVAIGSARHRLALRDEAWWQLVLFLRPRDGRIFTPARRHPRQPATPPQAGPPEQAIVALLREKLRRLSEAHALETDVAVRFKLEHQIQQARADLARALGQDP